MKHPKDTHEGSQGSLWHLSWSVLVALSRFSTKHTVGTGRGLALCLARTHDGLGALTAKDGKEDEDGAEM